MFKLSFKLFQSLLSDFQVKFIFLEAISYLLYSSSFLLHNYSCARWHIYCYFRHTDWEAVHTTIAWNFWIQSLQNPKTQNCNCGIIGFATENPFGTSQRGSTHSIYWYISFVEEYIHTNNLQGGDLWCSKSEFQWIYWNCSGQAEISYILYYAIC